MLRVVDRPDPQPGPDELLVRIHSTSVNRGDVLQRQGRYPPPPAATDVLGLELAGVVEALGSDVAGRRYPQAPDGWHVGDEVCAVVTGGGYAELGVVPAAVAMPVPPGCDLTSAGGIVEVFATAYDNLVLRPHLQAGETVLIHGGASGVGTAAIQLGRRAGCRVLVTAGTPARVAACRELGADDGVVYRDKDLADAILTLTAGRGVDVVLDVMGASYLAANLRLLAPDGRLAVIGLQGGTKAELNLGVLLAKRLTVLGSTLRTRPLPAKAALMEQLHQQVWPGFADGSIRPVIDRFLSLNDISEAHKVLERSEHVGKIVLIAREAHN